MATALTSQLLGASGLPCRRLVVYALRSPLGFKEALCIVTGFSLTRSVVNLY